MAKQSQLAHSPKFREILGKSRRDIEKTGGIPHDRFWQEVAAENQDKRSKARSRPRRI